MCRMCNSLDQYDRVKTYINDFGSKYSSDLTADNMAKFYVLPVSDVYDLVNNYPDLIEDLNKWGQWKTSS